MLMKKINELTPSAAEFILTVGRLADEKKIGIYLVGGFVRDLLLNVKNFDLDFVVEGDAVDFALELAKKISCKILVHRRFGTAVLTGLEGLKVDFASARKETYKEPAALPTVAAGTIKDDLLRRDFTINAMALRVHASGVGEWLDCSGGRKDLEAGVVRALHPLSFIDDPTRILRAVRFEQRFGFHMEKQTRAWIKRAMDKKYLHRVQKHRVRDELVLIFKEKSPVRCLKRLAEMGGLSFISPSLAFKDSWKNYEASVFLRGAWFKENFYHKKRHVEPYVMLMSLIFFQLPLKELRRLVFDFAFHKNETSRIVSLKEEFPVVSRELTRKKITASRVHQLCEPLSYEVILAMTVLSKNPLFFERVREFLFFYNGQRLHVKGEDLKAAGLTPGPLYKKILEELLCAKIDGLVKSREEELQFLKKWAGDVAGR